MAYKRGVEEGVAPRAEVVQYYFNSVGITGGGRQCNDWLAHKSVEVNEYLEVNESLVNANT